MANVLRRLSVSDRRRDPGKSYGLYAERGHTLPIALGSENSSQALNPEGFPSLVTIDTAGRVRLIHTGYDRSEQFESRLSGEIDALLSERP